MFINAVGILVLFHFGHVCAGSDRLPPIYAMEDYDLCMKGNDSYCKADIKLTNSGDENNTLWIAIQGSWNNRYCFDRSIIHRGICVPKERANSQESIRQFIETVINNKLKGDNLTSEVEEVICTKADPVEHDIYLMLLLVLYLFLISYATWYDQQQRMDKFKVGEPGHRILVSLSLISNWQKLSKVDGKEDYTRLKSIQGIRVFTMFLIIQLHSFMTYGFVYISNPDEIVKGAKYSGIQFLLTLSVFLVQCFFLISTWIVTYQIYNIYRDYGKFTAKQASILIINRYFRLTVCSNVVVLFMKSSWFKLFDGRVTFNITVSVMRCCRENWWKNIFLINNYYAYFDEVCNPVSWYISVDFQLYVAAVFTLYIILKFNLKELRVLSLLLCLYYVIYGLYIYFNDMDIIFRVYIDLMKPSVLRKSKALKVQYTSLYVNWGTSILGVWFGVLYTKNKHYNITNQRAAYILWMLLFLIWPYAVVALGMNESRGVKSAILGPLFKPLFSLGIGAGILGMSYNIGGIIKRVCECKWILILSNFSYSIYIFQFVPFYLLRQVEWSTFEEFGLIESVFRLVLMEIPIIVMLGVFAALLFEQPGINFQKMLLPQVSSGKRSPEKQK